MLYRTEVSESLEYEQQVRAMHVQACTQVGVQDPSRTTLLVDQVDDNVCFCCARDALKQVLLLIVP